MMQDPTGTHITRRLFIGATGAAGVAGLMPSALLARGAADWPAVKALVDRYVAARRFPGGVALIGRGSGAGDVVAAGTLAQGGTAPMTADTLFRVYSMTKPVTGMAAMMLVEDGRITLDTPVADVLPELAKPTVLTDPQRSLAARPAKAPITLRHLLTHTAGFGYAIVTKGPLLDAYLKNGINPAAISRMTLPALPVAAPTPGPDEFLRRLGKLPLIAEPGTRWSYSIALDVAALLVARIAQQPFEAFLQERLFGPLGMTSSFFQVPRAQVARLADNHAVLGRILFPVDPGAGSVFLDRPAFAFGGAGLVTSPRDYDRFLAMLLGGGALGGVRVMKPETVALATSDLLPRGVDTRNTLAEGQGFGAGGRVGRGALEGTFGWAGAAGTVGFIHRKLGLRAGAYAQYLPAEAYPFRDEFMRAVAADASVRSAA